ncbi:tRNA (N6-threonylcarbamoyladenosine(37)-N6)-methyltransferase TrmO [bacterium]|nr:tRNA (N6-threonylcarbamoyladenosine(37)-N6)-methyltransferase TrmO [bacterium]
MSVHSVTFSPIGIIHSPFIERAGTPIQPARAEGVEGQVVVRDEYAEGLADLELFERIWLVYWFDRAGEVKLKARPFLDDNERGIFAIRGPNRPNPIGISPVRLLKVEGSTLHVADIDILDGTPLLDIKPYAPQFDCFPDARAGWLDRAEHSGHSGTADDRFSD